MLYIILAISLGLAWWALKLRRPQPLRIAVRSHPVRLQKKR